jgi:DNA-binding response OmpR family regulator
MLDETAAELPSARWKGPIMEQSGSLGIHLTPLRRSVHIPVTAAGDTDGMQQTAGPLALSPTEARLYAILAEHAGQAVPAEDLQQQIWGAATPATAVYLALYVRYLQHKLAAHPEAARLIRLRRGRGYVLVNGMPPAGAPAGAPA